MDLVKSEDLLQSENHLPTHRKNSKPISIQETNNLLVSLKQYLGNFDSEELNPPFLELISAGRPLVLKDDKGLIHKSYKINIGWKQSDLEVPITFARQVIGPFASFESAKRISILLEQDEIKNTIARPFDWEIWVPLSIDLPAGIKAKIVRERVLNEVKPVLKVANGEYELSSGIRIQAPDGLLWEGGLYSGEFLLKPDAYGTWTFLEQVSLEKYLLGVLPHEIGSSSPASALAAQAVLARTWALANSNRFHTDGYHLCSDTQGQVYKDPAKANQAVVLAIKQTSGKVLTWEGSPINAVYHATNGGISAAGHEAWSITPVPYLRPFLDGSQRWKKKFFIPLLEDSDVKRFLSYRDGAFGNSHHLFRWKRILRAEDIKEILKFSNSHNNLPHNISVLQRGSSGRVLALQITGKSDNSKMVLRLDEIRRSLRNLPSTLFIIQELEPGVWEFIGGGFGHGAGLSQAGAIDLALRGWTTRKILKYYYPGTTYESFQ